MRLNEYQEQAMKTCMPSSENFSYMILNLVGEMGEFASKVAKGIRKEELIVDDSHLYQVEGCGKGDFSFLAKNKLLDKELQTTLKLEAGDILWQLAGLCKVMGWTLEDIAQMNLDKLADRQRRNKINGDGDYR